MSWLLFIANPERMTWFLVCWVFLEGRALTAYFSPFI